MSKEDNYRDRFFLDVFTSKFILIEKIFRYFEDIQ